MGIAGDNCKNSPVVWSLAAKLCDSCKSSAALLFCRADSAYLCMDCDAKIHGANKLASRHERVWLCEVCEQAPASVTCKADAAALCVTCDRDIHSANPLARRHERFPVVPFYDSPVKYVAGEINFLVPSGEDHATGELEDDEDGGDSFHEEAEAASWLLPNPNSKIVDAHDIKSTGDILFTDMDPFLDFDYAASVDAKFHQQQLHNSGADSVVPVQTKTSQPPVMNHHHESLENCFESEFCRSKISSFNSYASQSLSHSVSSSSMDAGVVPEGNSLSESSYSFGRQLNTNIDFGVSATTTTTTNTTTTAMNQMVSSQLIGLDREARVLRYREKRKNRKFEKTIRYASRKAYAETRPRIKGRFAKRTNIDSDVDAIYPSSGAFMVDTRYGVVPSF